MKTILIATDFSAAASNAAIYAADMAYALHADMFVLHVCNVPVSFNEIPAVVTEEEMIQDAEAHITRLKNELMKSTKGEINIRTEVLNGSFFPNLKEACARVKPYVVVMGSQGKSAVERMFFGSHAEHSMQHLTWPLITVPPETKFSWLKKIGLACDFDHVIETTPLDEIKRLVRDFNAELHVLNTRKKEAYNPELVFQSGLLQEMLSDLKPAYHFASSTDIDEDIMAFAETNRLDLLIVLPRRHSLLDKLIHKSHTKQMVLYSHVPVMALHR